MRNILTYLLLMILLVSAGSLRAESRASGDPADTFVIIISEGIPGDTVRFGHYNIIIHSSDTVKQKRCNRWLAAGADILTGPLGGHRIYMGTKPWVPVIYAVTLGGGMGFLPVADLFVILFTKDLDRYCDNPQVIMWL